MGSTEGGGVDGDRNDLASLGESPKRKEKDRQKWPFLIISAAIGTLRALSFLAIVSIIF